MGASGGDTITFDVTVFPPGSPVTITLVSVLPAITQGSLTLDASNAGVILDGGGLPAGSNGLTLQSNGNVIRGLQILRCPNAGVTVGGAGNTIGGDRTVGSGPLGQGNLISGGAKHGVEIEGPASTGNTVIGNRLGTTLDGAAAMPNGMAGVIIGKGAHGNTIGGSTAGQRNLISGNGEAGVEILGGDAMTNTVIGNYIGTDVSGATRIGNGWEGIRVEGPFNRVGGSASGEGNLISGNAQSGIRIGGDAARTTVVGNYIGTNASGTASLGNGGPGVSVEAPDNRVGGTAPGEGNLISGNVGHGVALSGSSSRNNGIVGNRIGTDVSGAAALGNGGAGVSLGDSAQYNTIGSATAGGRNVLAGNQYGVLISGVGAVNKPHHNMVIGNYMGTDISGSSAIRNTKEGVRIEAGAIYNRIGGAASGEGNLISGNGQDGVVIMGGGTMSNTVSGNLIGTDASGAVRLGNTGNGVRVADDAQYNVIGDGTSGGRNVIAGNANSGVAIGVAKGGPAAHHNAVIGNYIGTNLGGTAAISNTQDGVSIDAGATYNRIGGSSSGERNLISGNASRGVAIQGTGTMSNVVSGNYIGTNASGTAAIGNRQDAVLVAAASNRIGGANAGEGNLISGNAQNGISVVGSAGRGNAILGNLIGTDASGAVALGNNNGILLADDAQYNSVGDGTSGGRNVISGNAAAGVLMTIGKGGLGAHHNVVRGNLIGTNSAGTVGLGNGVGVEISTGSHDNTVGGPTMDDANLVVLSNKSGVHLCNGAYNNHVLGNYLLGNGEGVGIQAGAQHNTIGPGNVIGSNQTDGVWVSDAATLYNTVTRNSIFFHPRQGINNVAGGNGELPPPVISGVGPLTVTGTACVSCTVEFFSDTEDEGRVYEGTTTTDGSGSFRLSKPACFAGPNVTATATDANGNTSEFSSPVGVRYVVYLPLALKRWVAP